MDFFLPVYPEDLEVAQSGSRFHVKRIDDFESPDSDPAAVIEGVIVGCVRASAHEMYFDFWRAGELHTFGRAAAAIAISSTPQPIFSSLRRLYAVGSGVGEVLAEAEVLCSAMLENRVFDRLYSLIKSVSRSAQIVEWRAAPNKSSSSSTLASGSSADIRGSSFVTQRRSLLPHRP